MKSLLFYENKPDIEEYSRPSFLEADSDCKQPLA